MNGGYDRPVIPHYVTVHLGGRDSEAESITLSFPEYLKGVASATIDPDMPLPAIYALLYGQITKAVYRINDRTYRKMGYSFDLTSDAELDQPFDSNMGNSLVINRVIDSIFDTYITRGDSIVPIEAEVCYNGRGCRGLSAVGAAEMAYEGRTYKEILEYYYGNDVKVEEKVEIEGQSDFILDEVSLGVGDVGRDVSSLQIVLNMISKSYGEIPYVASNGGIFDEGLAASVRTFQRIFDLEESGRLDKATYYKLFFISKALNELEYVEKEKGLITELSPPFRPKLSYGSVGNGVKLLQYYLYALSLFEESVPPLQVIGVFGEKTYRSLIAFQRLFGFQTDGVATEEVWDTLEAVYYSIYDRLPPSVFYEGAEEYGGNILVEGYVGREVGYLQLYLNKVAQWYGDIPEITVNGEFDGRTEEAVRVFQQLFGISPTGVVTSTTWNALKKVYDTITAGEKTIDY